MVTDLPQDAAGRVHGPLPLRDADSSAASPVRVDAITTCGIEVTGMIRSVLPIPDPPTSITHTGSPDSDTFAA